MLKWEVFYNFCMSQMGTPYLLGGAGKDGKWDCSGLMQAACKEIGVSFYHGATTAYNRLLSVGYPSGDIANLDRSRPAILFHQDSKNPKVMAHTGFQKDGRVLQSGGRWGKGTHTNPLYNSDWTKYIILPQFDEEFQGEPKHPTLWGCGVGYWVVKVQTRLMECGYNVGTAGADGVFGRNTLEAVRKFQLDNGLKVDGIVGTKTIEKLYGAPSVLYTVTLRHIPEQTLEALKKYGEMEAVRE